MDLGVFGFISGALLLIFFLADRSQLTAFESFRVNNNPSFNVSHNQIAYSQVYLTAVPLILAVAGAMVIRRRGVALALLSGVFGAPDLPHGHGQPLGRSEAHRLRAPVHVAPDRGDDLPGAAAVAGIRSRSLLSWG